MKTQTAVLGAAAVVVVLNFSNIMDWLGGGPARRAARKTPMILGQEEVATIPVMGPSAISLAPATPGFRPPIRKEDVAPLLPTWAKPPPRQSFAPYQPPPSQDSIAPMFRPEAEDSTMYRPPDTTLYRPEADDSGTIYRPPTSDKFAKAPEADTTLYRPTSKFR